MNELEQSIGGKWAFYFFYSINVVLQHRYFEQKTRGQTWQRNPRSRGVIHIYWKNQCLIKTYVKKKLRDTKNRVDFDFH